MPFVKRSVMDQRIEFIALSQKRHLSFSELCRRFNISRPTGYKWLYRYNKHGIEGLEDRSRRPINFPGQTTKKVEVLIEQLRNKDPEWGPKKIRQLLLRMEDSGDFPCKKVPAASTIGSILRRRGLINKDKSEQARSWQRFEYEHPNELWQMDFKGPVLMRNEAYCYPLTITDDYSRYNIALRACDNQRYETVKEHLTSAFKTYGMPSMILCDNGSPWGIPSQDTYPEVHSINKLEKWMIRLNIALIHGRPHHPQTQGKEERFHKTLQIELLNYKTMKDQRHCQKEFNSWRVKYNHNRPHEAISMNVPADRYQFSKRQFPEKIPEINYLPGDLLRKVDVAGRIQFKGKRIRVGKALYGDYIALRPMQSSDSYEVYYANKLIRKVYL
jgi:transposase InsO family protein